MSRADRIVLAFSLAVVLGAVVVGQFDLVPRGAICWSVILLGRECAGCGLTRSFAAIGRGDLAAAAAFNPMGPLLFGSILLAGVLRVAKLAAPRFRFWAEADIAIGSFVALTMVTRLVAFYFL